MLRRDPQSIQGYIDMLQHFLSFGNWHLSHKGKGCRDQQLQLVVGELHGFLLIQIDLMMLFLRVVFKLQILKGSPT